MNIKTWVESKLISARVGVTVKIANNGKPIDELVIRYKDYFLMIDLDAETGEPTGNFGWSDTPMTHTPIRDFWTAHPPKSKGK